MKRLFLSISILLCASFLLPVNAQDKKRNDRRGFPLQKELNLSSEQKQKIESANTDFISKMKELKDNSNLSKEDRISKMKEMREQHHAAVNNFLTPDQQTKMKELAEKRGEFSKKRDDSHPRNIRPQHDRKSGVHSKMMSGKDNRMKELNLTDEQKQKIKDINDDFMGKKKDLAQQHRDALNNIYTPEQQEKLKEIRKNSQIKHRPTFNMKRGHELNLDEASKTKLKTLKEALDKEVKAVELSRIAPDAQKQKIKDLRDNYRKEKHQIIMDARKSKENKPA